MPEFTKEEFKEDLHDKTGVEKIGIEEVKIDGQTYQTEINKENDWYTGHGLGDIEGANTQGKTLDELRVNLVEAGRLILEAKKIIDLAHSYKINIEQGPNSYGASVENLPGVIAIGETTEEVEKNIRQAILLHLAGLREEGQDVPQP